MKCVKCGRTAEYVYISMSLCEEHLIQFQQNTLITEPTELTPVLNEIPKGEPGPNLPIKPILLKGSGLVLANYTEWKGRKDRHGGYLKADRTWGWEFSDKFPPDIISLVQNAPQVVGGYVYETNEAGTTITKRKAKS